MKMTDKFTTLEIFKKINVRIKMNSKKGVQEFAEECLEFINISDVYKNF